MSKFLLTVLAYVIIGPIIGALCVFAFGHHFAEQYYTSPSPDVSFTGLPIVLFFVILFGYILGGKQALLVGLITGLAQLWPGTHSILVPLAAAIFAWVLTMWTAQSSPTQFLEGGFFGENSLLWLGTSLVSAAGVWLVQYWWGRRQAT